MSPRPDELAKEINGYARRERHRSEGPERRVLMPAGQQLDSFAQLRDDGTTACGCWIYSGCYTETRQHDGAARQHRSGRIGASRRTGPWRGRPTGASSTTAPPATRRAAVVGEAQADRVERQPVGRLRRADYGPTGASRGRRALHHEPGRHGAAVRPRPDARRAVPRALRAVRIAARQPAGAEDQRQPGGARVQDDLRPSSATRTSSRMWRPPIG